MAFLQHSANLRLACSVLCGSWDSMFHESFRDRKGANSALFSLSVSHGRAERLNGPELTSVSPERQPVKRIPSLCRLLLLSPA